MCMHSQKLKTPKLLHAANLMAQYLDNNEDGTVDNPELLTTLKANSGHIYLWKTEAQQGGLPLQESRSR